MAYMQKLIELGLDFPRLLENRRPCMLNPMTTDSERPNIFNYENYRNFLRDVYLYMNARDKKFSFRYFARVTGFKSHSFLRLIMDGKSNLSSRSIDQLVRGFKFGVEEARFFRDLVRLNQATTHEEKNLYAKAILRSKTYRAIHPLSESQYQYFSCWYYSVIREFVGLAHFREDAEWIASQTLPPIRPEEAKGAIESLLKMGLLQRDERGLLKQSTGIVSTPAEVSSLYITNWHKEYIKRGAESIESTPRESRDVSAVTLALAAENVPVVKEMIANFRTELVHVALQQPKRDRLYQLNIQFFPLTLCADEKGEK
jgi:uncharacterized protein (TIGR02147 family)